MTDHDGNARIRVLVADDHPLLREGIAAVIEGQGDMVLVGEAGDGIEVISAYRALRPDVVLMDLRMPRLGGLEAMRAIRGEFTQARIVVLTTYSGDVQAVRALEAGASAYLLKSMLRKELVDTIRLVHRGQRHVPAEIAMEIASHQGADALSARELDVLRLVAAGNPNKLVASRLGIAEETVKAHMKNIFAKLAANDRTHAVAIALKRGILDT